MGNSSLSLLKEPKQRKLLFSAGLSWMFDAMDVGMISFVVAALAAESLADRAAGGYSDEHDIDRNGIWCGYGWIFGR